MNYKKKEYKEFDLHLINTDRFKNIKVAVILTKDFERESLSYSNLLAGVLTYSSKKYNAKNEVATKLEELYCSDISIKHNVVGHLEYLQIDLDFINPKYTDMNVYYGVFDMFKELILNPNVKNNEFDLKTFNMIKTNTINNYKTIKDNTTTYATLKYNELMFKSTPYQYSPITEMKAIESITPKNLYTFYKKIFNSYKINVVVVGEFDEDIIEKNVVDIMKPFKKANKELKNIYLNQKIKNKDINAYKDSTNHSQSNLLLGLRFDELTEFELKYVLPVYNMILGSMNNSILFVKVREENSLCYHISSYTHKYVPSLTIEAGINKENFDKTMDLIDECIISMNKESTFKPLLKNAVSTINLYLNDYYDNINKIIDYYYLNNFDNIEEVSIRKEKFSKVTEKDLVNLNKKIFLSTIYFLEGGKSEEN